MNIFIKMIATAFIAVGLTACGGGSSSVPEQLELNGWQTMGDWVPMSEGEEIRQVMEKSIKIETGQDVDVTPPTGDNYNDVIVNIAGELTNMGYTVSIPANTDKFYRGDIIWIWVNNNYHLAVVLDAPGTSSEQMNVWTPVISDSMLGTSLISRTLTNITW